MAKHECNGAPQAVVHGGFFSSVHWSTIIFSIHASLGGVPVNHWPIMTDAHTPLIDHRQGILLAGTGVVVLSFDALLVRLADTGPANVAFWRGTLMCVSVLLFILASGRRRELGQYCAHGWAAIIVTVLYGINSGLFVFSISHTRVANAVVILSSSALFAAFFSWLILREKIRLGTWIAIAVSMAGVMLVFAGSLGLSNWTGDLSAIILAMVMGLTLTLVRRLPDLPRMPVVAFSGIVTCALAVGFAEPFSAGMNTYGWLALMGLIQIPVASVLLMMATRFLPSPEVSLFLLIETILGPIWVWLVLNESVPPMTLIGGTVILSAVFVHSWLALKDPKTTVSAPIEPPM